MATYEDRTRLANIHYNNLVQKDTLPTSDDFVKGVLNNTIAGCPTTDLYFSSKNFNALHEEIINRVKTITGNTISRQSDYDLLLVMRSIYLQFSNNDPTNVIGEVRWLNRKVLEFVIPNIISNMSQYLKYIAEVGKNPTPLSYGQNVSIRGTKTPEMNGF